MTIDPERALRGAHEACPLCEGHAVHETSPCGWYGHAAIDRAVRAAWLNGEDTGWHRCHRGMTGGDRPSWLPADKETT